MSAKKPHKGSLRKKLSLNKQTLKDLAPEKTQSANVRGGVGQVCTYARSGCDQANGG